MFFLCLQQRIVFLQATTNKINGNVCIAENGAERIAKIIIITETQWKYDL